jgi:hypothetical protein
MVLQCINGVSSNPVEGRTKIWHLKNLILTLWFNFQTYSTLQVYQRSCSQVGHIPPKMSDKCADKFESQHSQSPTIWSDIMVVVGRESGYLKIFFTFLEVNMSNILWSMRICKRTFFPVCRMSGYVNTLVYFYLAPYSRQEG